MTCISIHGYTKYWIRFVDSLWGFGHDLLDPGRFLLGWGCLDSLATLPPAMLAEMSMSTGKALPRDAGCEGELIGTTRGNYLSLRMCCKPERSFCWNFHCDVQLRFPWCEANSLPATESPVRIIFLPQWMVQWNWLFPKSRFSWAWAYVCQRLALSNFDHCFSHQIRCLQVACSFCPCPWVPNVVCFGVEFSVILEEGKRLPMVWWYEMRKACGRDDVPAILNTTPLVPELRGLTISNVQVADPVHGLVAPGIQCWLSVAVVIALLLMIGVSTACTWVAASRVQGWVAIGTNIRSNYN